MLYYRFIKVCTVNTENVFFFYFQLIIIIDLLRICHIIFLTHKTLTQIHQFKKQLRGKAKRKPRR